MNLVQGFKIQGQHTKTKCISTYKQRIGKRNLKKYQLKVQQQKTYRSKDIQDLYTKNCKILLREMTG